MSKNMRVTMLETTKGSPDGAHVKTYEAGETYSLPDSLAKAFLGMGAAEKTKRSSPTSKETDPDKDVKTGEGEATDPAETGDGDGGEPTDPNETGNGDGGESTDPDEAKTGGLPLNLLGEDETGQK